MRPEISDVSGVDPFSLGLRVLHVYQPVEAGVPRYANAAAEFQAASGRMPTSFSWAASDSKSAQGCAERIAGPSSIAQGHSTGRHRGALRQSRNDCPRNRAGPYPHCFCTARVVASGTARACQTRCDRLGTIGRSLDERSGCSGSCRSFRGCASPCPGPDVPGA